MSKLKNINHKLIFASLGIIFFIYLISDINKYVEYKKEIGNLKNQITMYKQQSSKIIEQINLSNETKKGNSDLSYYISNIYAYSFLNDIKVEVRNGKSSYKNTKQINILHEDFNDKEKHKEFLIAISYLGYIENATKNNVLLNVYDFSIEDAKKLITNQKDNSWKTKSYYYCL